MPASGHLHAEQSSNLVGGGPARMSWASGEALGKAAASRHGKERMRSGIKHNRENRGDFRARLEKEKLL